MKGRRTRTILTCLEEGAERPGPDSSDAMNAMDYEKKYNEALERARKIHDEIVNNEVIGFPGQITDIFPELAESEDERIRKQLVDIVAFIPEANFTSASREDCRAYLEKQKEPENVNASTMIPSCWEVGLEKEIERYTEETIHLPITHKRTPMDIMESDWVRCASHFYELGLNAKKESK